MTGGFSMSRGTKVTLNCLFCAIGRGTVRYMKGSNVIDSCKSFLVDVFTTLMTYLVTLGTNQGALQLPLEQIDNDTVVSLLIPVPALLPKLSQLLVATTRLPIGLLDIRFLQNPVQVLMQTIQQESNELLSVVLSIASELRGEPGSSPFELAGRVGAVHR